MDKYGNRDTVRETSRRQGGTGSGQRTGYTQSREGVRAESTRSNARSGGTQVRSSDSASMRSSGGSSTRRTGSAAARGSSSTLTRSSNSATARSSGSTATRRSNSAAVRGSGAATTRRSVPSSVANDPRYRARQAARRRRRQRQRRILILIFMLLLLLIGGGVFAGVRHFSRQGTKNALRGEGITAMQSGDYQTAVEKFDAALALSGKKTGSFETDVLQYRAEASYNLQDYAGSLEIWQKLIEQDPENEEYKENAVLCLLETGDYDGALALGVLQSRVYNRIALEKIQQEDYDGALAAIDQGLAADDGSMAADLAFNQAAAYEGKRDFGKALELFQAYAATYGADEAVQREITFLESRQGNASETSAEGDAGTETESGAEEPAETGAAA